MPITFMCPNPDCGKSYTVPDEAAGRKTTCTRCGMRLQVPAASKGPPPPPDHDEIEERPRSRRRADDYDDADIDVEAEDGARSVARRGRGLVTSGGGFMDFVLFKFLIAPRILIVLYWVLVGLCILGGLGFMLMSLLSGQVASILVGILGGLLIMIVYPVFLRISFEFALVVFRIYDTLQEIRDNTTPHH